MLSNELLQHFHWKVLVMASTGKDILLVWNRWGLYSWDRCLNHWFGKDARFNREQIRGKKKKGNKKALKRFSAIPIPISNMCRYNLHCKWISFLGRKKRVNSLGLFISPFFLKNVNKLLWWSEANAITHLMLKCKWKFSFP